MMSQKTRYGLSQDEWSNLALSVNTHRGERRLSPTEVASLAQRAAEHESLNLIAESLNMRDASTLRRIVSLAALDADLQSLVAWGARPGRVGFSAASELQGLRDPQAVREAFHAALRYELTKEEARQVKQAYLRGQGAVSKCVDAALRTRPRVDRRDVVLGAITEEILTVKLSQVAAGDRDSAFAALLVNVFPGVVFIGAGLNAGYFSLVLDSANAKLLRSALNDKPLENIITTAVGEWLSKRNA